MAKRLPLAVQSQIRRMARDGKSPAEIAAELKLSSAQHAAAVINCTGPYIGGE